MTDRLFIRHPAYPERNGHVTRTAFDALWSKKGYEIVAAEPLEDPQTATPDQLNAELDRRAAADEPDPPAPEPAVDEKADLTAKLEAAGVTVDRRWGIKRLRTEVANLAEDQPDQVCSVCGAPAAYEIKGAPTEKGNLACEDHRGMWPLSLARPLAEVPA